MTANLHPFWRRLGARAPVMLAPMPGAATPALVAGVIGAGGLGVIPADFLAPGDILAFASEVRALADGPLAISLRVPPRRPPAPLPPEGRAALEAVIGDIAAAMDPPPAELFHAAPPEPSFDEQLEAALEARPAAVMTVMGGLAERYADRARAAGALILGAATCLREAKVLRSAGADAVVAQGAEAGGPRLSFEVDPAEGQVGLMSLVGAMARATGLPVIASGGVMTGRQAAALELAGAAGVMAGTLFLRAPESAAPQAHKDALAFCADTDTAVTDFFEGVPARAVANSLAATALGLGIAPEGRTRQRGLLLPLLRAAAATGQAGFMAMYAGQGASLARAEPCAQAVARLLSEREAAFKAFSGEQACEP
ncbi:MAG: nitronate monooxygenase [Duodenibacillus sp.]|nr:nitronate monooxygenase [Duodenibacillus sp.]